MKTKIRLSQLVEDLAERFAIEPARARGVARNLREAGLLTQGARGVNAPSITPLDIARLLIGLALPWRPAAKVALDVKTIGSLVPGEADKEMAIIRKQLQFENFESCLAAIIVYAAQFPSDHDWDEEAHAGLITISPDIGLAEAVFWPRPDEDGERIVAGQNFVSQQNLDWLEKKTTQFEQSHIERGFSLRPVIDGRQLFNLAQVAKGEQPLFWRIDK